MKKYIISCICLLFLSSLASAQVSKDSLLKMMSKETCDEIAKKDISNKSMEELELELGLAMMPVIIKYEKELKSVYNMDFEDEKSMENIGREVGMKLAKDCPVFLKMFMSNPQAMKESMGKESKTLFISGTLVKIIPGDISHIQVKDASGKIEKLWWMEYFEGSNKLVNESQNHLNKAIKVSYVEKEIYNSTLKDYVKMKIITAVE